jgi:hypothetical protein
VRRVRRVRGPDLKSQFDEFKNSRVIHGLAIAVYLDRAHPWGSAEAPQLSGNLTRAVARQSPQGIGP